MVKLQRKVQRLQEELTDKLRYVCPLPRGMPTA